MKTSTLALNQTICVKVLFIAIILVIFSYVYMVNAIAFNAAARESSVAAAAVLESEIGDLESELLSVGRQNNKNLAIEFGLVKSVTNEALIVIRDTNTRLTLND